ncbi:unnamed protein product [Discosporangium mesarthrocarpum]
MHLSGWGNSSRSSTPVRGRGDSAELLTPSLSPQTQTQTQTPLPTEGGKKQAAGERSVPVARPRRKPSLGGGEGIRRGMELYTGSENRKRGGVMSGGSKQVPPPLNEGRGGGRSDEFEHVVRGGDSCSLM